MRKLLAVVFFYSISLIAKSQNLTVEGTVPDLYITHIVAPKENFYSVSRLYNQPPKSIASFNNIVMEKGLTIGQHIKIPLNAQNFDSSGSSNANGALIPLTHIVASSETLFKIGSDVNVSAQSIRKWNNLSSDKIAPGTPLIIGYLNTNNAQSPASPVKNNTASAENNNEPAQKNVKDSQVISNSTPAIPKKDTALAVIPEETTEPGNTAGTPVKEEPVKQQETLTKNEDGKKINQSTANGNVATGTFEDIYSYQASQKSENTKSGEAATFKSTSGWQDKKYYVLMNDVTPGTIVKISSSENKAVYAKVLGSMPEMKENNGLLLRISNAAASYLGIIDPKFPVQISYYQ